LIEWNTVGRSHDAEYRLFRIGHHSTEGFKEFTEKGRSDALDAQSQGEGGIFDEFSGPPVTTGEGRTEAEFFVDSNHSMVSPLNHFLSSILLVLRIFDKETNQLFDYILNVNDGNVNLKV